MWKVPLKTTLGKRKQRAALVKSVSKRRKMILALILISNKQALDSLLVTTASLICIFFCHQKKASLICTWTFQCIIFQEKKDTGFVRIYDLNCCKINQDRFVQSPFVQSWSQQKERDHLQRLNARVGNPTNLVGWDCFAITYFVLDYTIIFRLLWAFLMLSCF